MNIFLVLSPLQVLNALEAKARFGTQNNVLVVLRHTAQGYPLSTFKRVVDENDWDKVYYLATYDEERVESLSTYRWAYLSWLQQRRLDGLAAELGRADKLFAGSYLESIVRHFVNALPHGSLYILDSGTDTFMINQARRPRTTLAPFGASRVLAKLAGTRDRQADAVTFFSAYHLDVQPHDRLVPNRYERFRERVSQGALGDEVWFLGEPLVLDGYLSESTYLHYLKQVHLGYRDRHFVYLPHSRERSADVERIRALLGCEVRSYGLPIELPLSRADPRPDEVVSFVCAALTNLHIMFGAALRVTAVYLESEHVLVRHAYIADIYKQFALEADDHFKVVRLAQVGASGRSEGTIAAGGAA